MADGTLTQGFASQQAALPTLSFTPDVEAATAEAWEKVRAKVTPIEWRTQAPLIAEINRLKAEKNAVILAHNYMTPDIFHGVWDPLESTCRHASLSIL